MRKRTVEIRNRYTVAVQWSGKIDDQGSDSKNLGEAIKAAIKAGDNLTGAYLWGANLWGANLQDADLRSAELRHGMKIKSLRIFAGLYVHICMAIVDESGIPWVRMGCLWHTVEEWDRIGIRESNIREFPNDGSPKSEERVRAFEFVRATAIAMAKAGK